MYLLIAIWTQLDLCLSIMKNIIKEYFLLKNLLFSFHFFTLGFDLKFSLVKCFAAICGGFICGFSYCVLLSSLWRDGFESWKVDYIWRKKYFRLCIQPQPQQLHHQLKLNNKPKISHMCTLGCFRWKKLAQPALQLFGAALKESKRVFDFDNF